MTGLLAPGDIVLLADAWVLLAALWMSRFDTGSLDEARVIFGFLMFFLVTSPRARRGFRRAALEDAGPLLARVAIAYAVATAVATLSGAPSEPLLVVAAVSAPALVAGRAAAYAIERGLQRHRGPARVLVIGGGAVARRLVRSLTSRREYALELAGVVDDDPSLTSSELGTRILGRIEDAPDIAGANDVSVAVVAFGSDRDHSTVEVVRELAGRGVDVWVVPRFFDLGHTTSDRDHLWGVPVERVQPPAQTDQGWVLKRVLDVVLAFLILSLLWPLLAAIAVAVYLDSGRPVLFRQLRLGADGRPFEILKFRTMTPAGEIEETEWAADNSRTTRVGRLLRRTNLDELPQLVNVLRGEMSLVGPRPERPHFVTIFSDLYPSYPRRHRLPAGITGWAQVHGLRGDTSIEDRAAFDNYYIDNWSLGTDLRIICRTFGSFVKRL